MEKLILNTLWIDRKTALALKNKGWIFDWDVSYGAISEKIGAFINGDIQGIVEFERVPQSRYNFIYRIESAPHNIGKSKIYDNVAGTLLAYVARDSFNYGFDGFVVLKSKTILASHYIKKYGAKIIGTSDRLYFDTKASKKLIQTYLGGKYEN